MIKMGQVDDALTGQNPEIPLLPLLPPFLPLLSFPFFFSPFLLPPFFFSVDPWRDSVFQVHKYVQNYHKAFRGLTGTPEQVSRICKG